MVSTGPRMVALNCDSRTGFGKLRLCRNMTQQELADGLRLAGNTIDMYEIAMYETGDCEPCHDLTHRIADIPGTTTDYRDPQTTQPVRFSRLLLMGACERRWSA
jgi:transcriptional regulator with XRE-family HTH domain